MSNPKWLMIKIRPNPPAQVRIRRHLELNFHQ